MKKIIFVAMLAVTVFFASNVYAGEPNLILNRGEDFKNGEYYGVSINDDKIEISSGLMSGYYDSPEIATADFKNAVASWNAKTDSKSYVTLYVKIKQNDTWSRWFSYGTLSNGSSKPNASVKGQADKVAKMDVDTIIASAAKGSAIKYRVFLQRDSLDTSPNVSLVSFALQLHNAKQSVIPRFNETVDIPVPERSQMVVPKIGSVICSPTTLSMILEYYGINEATATVASGAYDKGSNIYGNWSFNMAYAAEKGLTAYVDRGTDINDVVKYLTEGVPVGLSIKTKSNSELEGAPQAYPSGHLIVARGYTEINGVPYIIVNDPASKDVSAVKRYYRADQLNNAWSGVMYVVKS